MMNQFYELSKIETEYLYSQHLIEQALNNNDYNIAMQECYNWADIIAHKFGFAYNKNWKIFKKKLVACYFGAPPSRSFSKGESALKDFSDFLSIHKDASLRMTIHKKNEACHSKSVELIKGKESELFFSALNDLEHEDHIIVFPESSGPNSICFRCAITAFEQDIFYEAGYGQAYLSFEQERGLHPTASMQKSQLSKTYIPNGDASLVLHLNELISQYGSYLTITAECMRYMLGLDYVSIEGYFNYVEGQSPIIVDCDLPFDKVFFRKEMKI